MTRRNVRLVLFGAWIGFVIAWAVMMFAGDYLLSSFFCVCQAATCVAMSTIGHDVTSEVNSDAS